MTKEEKIKKEIELSFDHARAIIDNPALLDDITNGSAVVYLEDGKPVPKGE